MLETLRSGINCLGLWGILFIIFLILNTFVVFFVVPTSGAIENAKKELFKNKHTKEIFDEINNFTDEEREKLLFLVKNKNKEKKENIKNFFNDR